MKLILFCVPLLLLCGCNETPHQNSVTDAKENIAQSNNADSLKILDLLKTMYAWHEKNQTKLIDFDVVVEDTIQTRLNQKAFQHVLDTLKNTGFFTESFIDSYKALGNFIDKKLKTANPKYLNEINFPFQEADSWTYFQDDAEKFWETFRISDFKLDTDSCSLKWLRLDYPNDSPGYEVHFAKTDSTWKISYLEGFDIKNYN